MFQRHARSFFGAALVVAAIIGVTQAGPSHRQHYNDWTYYPQFGYYYSSYYYQPSPDDKGYKHLFCIYYPAYPRFVYYYDPYQHYYWGRLDVKGEPGHQYSLLAPKDRKAKLTEIPEDAFPKPGKMPPIPESKDGTPMEPVKILPKLTGNEGKSLPGPPK
ncbi:MAG TPA: hypothetical protein VMR25_17345 [Planctomycetaceae bacterium]|jgi:hypothetical protein|nr:hypothetical protein [Planctomycetaceae bacterium]